MPCVSNGPLEQVLNVLLTSLSILNITGLHIQLSIEYADINYCFANFKYAEGYVNISY